MSTSDAASYPRTTESSTSFTRENIAGHGAACVPHKRDSLATVGTLSVDGSFVVDVIITVVLHRCTVGDVTSRTDKCMRAVRVHIAICQ